MKQKTLLFKLRYLYVIAIFYFFSGYFYDSWLNRKEIYQVLEKYLGIQMFFLFGLLLFTIYPMFLTSRRKKMVIKVKLFFTCTLIFSVLLLFLMNELKFPLDKIFITEELKMKFIDFAIYRYNFGLIFTFVALWIFSYMEFYMIYILLYFLIFLSLFFLFAKMIRITISKILHMKKEKRRITEEKRKLEKLIKSEEWIEEIKNKDEMEKSINSIETELFSNEMQRENTEKNEGKTNFL